MISYPSRIPLSYYAKYNCLISLYVGISYRGGDMTRNMLLYRKEVRNSLHTHQPCIKAQTHTRDQTVWCLSSSARDAEKREEGWRKGREQAEDESRRRAIPIKNDSRQRTRQGTQRKKKYCWKRAKTKRILTGEELETKLNEALLRLADQGETGGQGWSLRGGGWNIHTPWSLVSKEPDSKNKVEGKR